MVEVTATIRNAMGIHCRPSAVIVRETRELPCDLELEAPQGRCDPRSIIALIALGLAAGTVVKLRVSGTEEAAVAGRVAELFERNFDFEPMPGSLSPLRGDADDCA